MSQQELLKRVVHLKIAYMVTGSVSSSIQGEPRMTHDIDLLIDVPADGADRLVEAFSGDGYYVSATAVHEALTERTTFNLIVSVRHNHPCVAW